MLRVIFTPVILHGSSLEKLWKLWMLFGIVVWCLVAWFNNVVTWQQSNSNQTKHHFSIVKTPHSRDPLTV